MVANRFAPARVRDAAQTSANSQVSQALDSLAGLGSYRPELGASVSVPAGAFRRLSARSAGQEVVLEEATARTFGQEICLFLEGPKGSTRVRAASGTINGASSVTFDARDTLVVLRSNGAGGWNLWEPPIVTNAGLADMAASRIKLAVTAGPPIDGTITQALDMAGSTRGSLPLRGAASWGVLVPGTVDRPLVSNGAGADPAYEQLGTNGIADDAVTPDKIDEAGIYGWSGTHQFSARVAWAGTFVTTLAASTNNLAIGAVTVVRIGLTGSQTLTGMVAGLGGQVVIIINADSGDTLTLAHLSASSSAANQFILPNNVNLAIPPRGLAVAYYDALASLWFVS